VIITRPLLLEHHHLKKRNALAEYDCTLTPEEEHFVSLGQYILPLLLTHSGTQYAVVEKDQTPLNLSSSVVPLGNTTYIKPDPASVAPDSTTATTATTTTTINASDNHQFREVVSKKKLAAAKPLITVKSEQIAIPIPDSKQQHHDDMSPPLSPMKIASSPVLHEAVALNKSSTLQKRKRSKTQGTHTHIHMQSKAIHDQSTNTDACAPYTPMRMHTCCRAGTICK
jgi:hypothetical protein